MSKQQLSLPGSDKTAIHGTVQRVVYANEDNAYTVLRVLVDGRTETWVGVCPRVAEGQPVTTHGELTSDSRWGEQRKCDGILPGLPNTPDGIEKWLANGSLPGIGPALAKAIVKMFGAATIDVIAERPDDLLRIPGFGQGKLQALKAAWPEVQLDAQVMCMLASLGAPIGLSRAIVKRYGDKAIAIISHSPYRLALEVRGVGFKTADMIAGAAGIAADSPERAQAGVLHVLSEATLRGDCYLPIDVLADRTADLLGEVCANTYEAIHALASTRVVLRRDEAPTTRIVVEDGAYGQIVYPRELYDAEVAVASRIREMLDSGSTELTGAAEAIADFEVKHGVTLAPAQRDAVQAAAKHRVVVITGSPGSGKSTLAKAILAVFDRAGVKYLLASPTGRAAKRLAETTGRSAATIHRTLGIPQDGNGRGFIYNRRNPLPVQALVMDEVSMCDVVIANSVMQALPTTARLVLIGDVDQLPSVGPGAVLRDVIASGVVPTIRLTQVFRQASGSAILDAALSVNAGTAPSGKNLNPNDMTAGEFFIETDEHAGGGDGAEQDESAMRAAKHVVRLATTYIPARFGYDPVDDLQVITPMIKGPTGTLELNRLLQNAINPGNDYDSIKRGDTCFRVGDKVIQTKNDYKREVFNGDLGRVSRIDKGASKLYVDMDGRQVEYERDDLANLLLAYAITCHRFQGSEQKAVVVVMRNEHYIMLSRNWAYTALTRGKKLCVLVTDPRALKTAVRETRREQRRTGLADRLRGDI